MVQRIAAVIVGVIGFYLAVWHSSPLPFNHFQVFGRDFGSQHSIHSIIGLVLLAVALWLWMKAKERRASTA